MRLKCTYQLKLKLFFLVIWSFSHLRYIICAFKVTKTSIWAQSEVNLMIMLPGFIKLSYTLFNIFPSILLLNPRELVLLILAKPLAEVSVKGVWKLESYDICQVTHIKCFKNLFNPLSANFTKWSNRLKQFVGKLPTNCFSVFNHLVGLTVKGLIRII